MISARRMPDDENRRHHCFLSWACMDVSSDLSLLPQTCRVQHRHGLGLKSVWDCAMSARNMQYIKIPQAHGLPEDKTL